MSEMSFGEEARLENLIEKSVAEELAYAHRNNVSHLGKAVDEMVAVYYENCWINPRHRFITWQLLDEYGYHATPKYCTNEDEMFNLREGVLKAVRGLESAIPMSEIQVMHSKPAREKGLGSGGWYYAFTCPHCGIIQGDGFVGFENPIALVPALSKTADGAEEVQEVAGELTLS